MNLENLTDENGLQQDEWSLTKPIFGEEDQLTVVGWTGGQGRHKLYILKCSKCSQDQELFGGGYFRSLKSDLVRDKVPCGCSRSVKWSKGQFTVMCGRKAKELGYTFLGFVGEWKGHTTKIKMLCEKHGEWNSGSTNHLINGGAACPRCRTDAVAEASTKPDDEMINSFFASGAFHPETKFWRSERKKRHWFLHCPECGETGESQSSDLQKGCRPCACSKHRQQEAYINWIVDDHNNAVAIKFGIARDSKQRIKSQDRQSAYTLKQHSVYVFLDVASCKKAERECRQELECGIVLKRDMSDGYTETTWVYNLDNVVEIYERNGGIDKETMHLDDALQGELGDIGCSSIEIADEEDGK